MQKVLSKSEKVGNTQSILYDRNALQRRRWTMHNFNKLYHLPLIQVLKSFELIALSWTSRILIELLNRDSSWIVQLFSLTQYCQQCPRLNNVQKLRYLRTFRCKMNMITVKNCKKKDGGGSTNSVLKLLRFYERFSIL